MQFSLSEEQRSFADALDGLLASSDVPAVNRAWAAGDREPGLKLWQRLAELGLPALLVPEEFGGIEGSPLDVAVAFERLGFHGVPGPWLESVVLAPTLLAGGPNADLLADVAEGAARITFAVAPVAPFALDAEACEHAFLVVDGQIAAARGTRSPTSVDASRKLHALEATEAGSPVAQQTVDRALDLAALAVAAAQLGAGEQMLAQAVTYVGQRKQFGRVIGEYQALKHSLADVKVALDFARPLVHGAALALAETDGPNAATAPRDVSAAKVAASDAAIAAARASLQAHGAIGYTMEHDLSLWILRTRALAGAWGTASQHRARVLDHLTRS